MNGALLVGGTDGAGYVGIAVVLVRVGMPVMAESVSDAEEMLLVISVVEDAASVVEAALVVLVFALLVLLAFALDVSFADEVVLDVVSSLLVLWESLEPEDCAESLL